MVLVNGILPTIKSSMWWFKLCIISAITYYRKNSLFIRIMKPLNIFEA